MNDTYELDDAAIVEEPYVPQLVTIEKGDVFCIQCGYNLRGLTIDRRCPECGTPVALSLRGGLLRYSSPDYLRKLHLGVFLILTAIVSQFLLIFIAIGLGLSMALAQPIAFYDISLIASLLGLAVSVVSLYGWWLFSSPDPAFVEREKGNAARRIVRISVILAAGMAMVEVSVELHANQVTAMATVPTVLVVALSLLGLAVSAVMFFASMFYMRWLTPRIPDAGLYRRSKTYLWLLPILTTVGVIACGLGPLIAIVLYWSHFEFARRHIKKIRAQVEAEFGPLSRA